MAGLRGYERVCFFAHFDHHDVVDPYVVHYLMSLRRHGFGIVFVSSSQLAEDEIAKIRPWCERVMIRDNVGLDFGSWASALAEHGDDVRGDLLLANDSVYGPIGDLGNVLARFDASPSDFFGLVESFEIAPHLQSWFLLFRPQAHRSAAFRTVFNQPFGTMSKRDIIRHGEVGLSVALRRAGLQYEAVFSPRQVCKVPVLCKLNPSIMLWRELPTHFRVPFLKVQALRDNPYAATDIVEWPGLIDEIEPGLSAHIARHLERSGARRVVRRSFTVPLLRWRNGYIHQRLVVAMRLGSRVGYWPSLVFFVLRQLSAAASRVKWLSGLGAK